MTEEWIWMMGVFPASLAVMGFVWCMMMIYELKTANLISDEIQIYESENKRLEEQIAAIVGSHIEFEKEVHINQANSFVNSSPELKSVSLVQQQLNMFSRNNEAIRCLKRRQIRIQKIRLLLYFG